MAKNEMLPGTLGMLILRVLQPGALHGYAIAQRIHQLSNELLQVEEGSLYPALQRMLLKGWVKAYMEGLGEETYREHSSWTQPPNIKHMILDYSDDVELLEVILPADFETVELTA